MCELIVFSSPFRARGSRLGRGDVTFNEEVIIAQPETLIAQTTLEITVTAAREISRSSSSANTGGAEVIEEADVMSDIMHSVPMHDTVDVAFDRVQWYEEDGVTKR